VPLHLNSPCARQFPVPYPSLSASPSSGWSGPQQACERMRASKPFRQGKHRRRAEPPTLSARPASTPLWVWGAVLAGALAATLQPLIGKRPDQAARTGTRRCATNSWPWPAGILRHARQITL